MKAVIATCSKCNPSWAAGPIPRQAKAISAAAVTPTWQAELGVYRRSQILAATRNNPQGEVSKTTAKKNTNASGVATADNNVPHFLLTVSIISRESLTKSRYPYPISVPNYCYPSFPHQRSLVMPEPASNIRGHTDSGLHAESRFWPHRMGSVGRSIFEPDRLPFQGLLFAVFPAKLRCPSTASHL